jgi:hypothetical protein
MSLLAEQLVEEWMILQGFFTVRGLRDGVSEIDLLGIRKTAAGVEGWHVESQVSFRPVSYVTPLSDEIARRFNKKKTSAWKRPDEVVAECVERWVAKKFSHQDKVAVREKMWAGVQWQYILVHGAIKHSQEVTELGRRIRLVSFHTVLQEICSREHGGFPGAAGADIADIVGFFHERQKVPNKAPEPTPGAVTPRATEGTLK